MGRTHRLRNLRVAAGAAAVAAGLAAAPSALAGTIPRGDCRTTGCSVEASASPRTANALLIVPRGTFFRTTYTWARTTIRPEYARTLREGAPVHGLTPWLSPAWHPLAPLPSVGDLPPGPARLEELGNSLGPRLVRRLRLEIDRDSEAAAADEEDGLAMYWRRKLRRELAIEACGLLAGRLGPALADGELSGQDLADLVSDARQVGRDHAQRAGTRSAYAEAAYLALTVADYAEGVVDVANDPGGYIDPGTGPGEAGRQLRDSLVNAVCRRALGGAGLSKVAISSGALGAASSIRYTVSILRPATPVMALGDGLRCGPPAFPFHFTRRCTWNAPFAFAGLS